MGILRILLIAVLVFGLCFLADKGFSRLFRSKVQHRSGLAVRASKRYGSFGVILLVLGIPGEVAITLWFRLFRVPKQELQTDD